MTERGRTTCTDITINHGYSLGGSFIPMQTSPEREHVPFEGGHRGDGTRAWSKRSSHSICDYISLVRFSVALHICKALHSSSVSRLRGSAVVSPVTMTMTIYVGYLS